MPRTATGTPAPDDLILLTAPEVRRLPRVLTEPDERQRFRLGWSWWRPRRQEQPRRSHDRRRVRDALIP